MQALKKTEKTGIYACGGGWFGAKTTKKTLS